MNLQVSDMLFYQSAWLRLEGTLRADFGDGDPLLMDAQGHISRGGKPEVVHCGSARVAWASPDIFWAGHIDRFLQIASGAGVEWLQSGSAGVDNPLFARLAASGVALTTSDATAASIAEMVLGSLMDHYQRGPERRAAQAAARWSPMHFRELGGSRWLIIGFGAIGMEIGRRARAFGAHVTGVRRSGGSDPAADIITTPADIASALGGADVVVLSLPLSSATRGMVDATFLAGMKHGSVFINVARGGLVDEHALLGALNAGPVEHAILDAFVEEPLPGDNPLWRHPRVAISSHMSGLGEGFIARSDAVFMENLKRCTSGRALRLGVDPSLFGSQQSTAG